MKKGRIFAFLPMIGMMCLIWMFSANSGDVSSGQSMGIVSRVITIGEELTGHTLTEQERVQWEERIHTPIRKMAHMTEYMIFALTVAFPFLLYHKSKKWISVFTYVYCVGYAGIDEIHQLFVPERAGQLRDVLIDSIGVLVGIILFRVIYGHRLRNRQAVA